MQFIAIALRCQRHLCPKFKPCRIDQVHVVLIRLARMQHLLGEQIVRVALRLGHKAAHGLVEQLAARQAQQAGGFQIGVHDLPGRT